MESDKSSAAPSQSPCWPAIGERMTPQYHAIIDYWKDDKEHLALEHTVWDPTPWVIDVRSPYQADGSDVDRYTHIQWLREKIGAESWPIHGKPGDWNFAGATVDGETWLGFRTEDMMHRFCEAFPQSAIRATTDAAMPANSANQPPHAAPTKLDLQQ